MTKEVKLNTTLEEFDKLHRLADGRGATVKVEIEALRHLLYDHSIMSRALEGLQGAITLIEPPRRARVRAKS